MATSVNAQDLESKLSQLNMTASQLASHHQDVTTPPTMASDSHLGHSQASIEGEEHIPLAQVEELKAQVETLKRNLQNVENRLSEETALRNKAECALDEYKLREKSLLQIEQDGKALQEEVKWRNEQFESLQEAHNRMRDQFHEGRNVWASEKAAMLKNIEVLSENAAELERLQAVVNDVRECNTKAERRIILLEDRLREAQRELQARSNLHQSLLTVQEHEEVVLAMRSECEALQRQLSTCDAERFELEKQRDKLLAESREKKQPHQREKDELLSNGEGEGRKDRSSISGGQRLVPRRQLEDFAKQVKSLNTELQKWKDVVTESNEASSKLKTILEGAEKENEDLKVQLNEWMQKAMVHNDPIKVLEANVEKCKHCATSRNDENELRFEELEHLRAEVEKWRNVAARAAEEGKSAKMESLASLCKFEDEMDVMSSKPTGECCSGRSSRKEELDCSRQGSGPFSNEWNHVASELETSLQVEVVDWKKRVVCAEKEQEDMRQYYETTVKELHLEVEAWKKSAACIAEDGRLERVELEKKLKDNQVKGSDATDHVAEERKRSAQELTEIQAELQNWKARAADAAEECTSLRNAHDNVIKELQFELAQCKEKSETATEEGKSVRANLEKVVQDLQNEVHVWKQKAEKALEGAAKNQEYEDLIKALDKERVSVQLQLERTLSDMEVKAAAATSETQALKGELDSTIVEKSFEIQQLCITITGLEAKLSELKVKADDNHSAQLFQLQKLLSETQSQLQEWQEKATVASHAEDELRQAVEEIRSQTENLHNFIRALKDELLEWKERAEHFETLQLQLTSSLAASQEELQSWKQKAVDAAMATDVELRNSVSDLETELSLWKEKAQEGEMLYQEMRNSLTETQMELQDMKEKIAAFASTTDSLKDELNSANELASVLTTQLCTQKQNEESLQKLNSQLETDLVLVREESLSRKLWMTQILTQLEGTVRVSQKELQNKLHLAQHRLLGNESETPRVGELAAAKAFSLGSDSTHDFVNCSSSPETSAPLESPHQGSKSDSLDFKSNILKGSVKNPVVDQLQQERSSLNSLVSKLEHVRGSDGYQSQASSVVGNDEKVEVADEIKLRASSLRVTKVQHTEVPGAVQRSDVLLQKGVESSRATQEFVQPQRIRIDSLNRSQAHSGARLKVLAEVDGNSLRSPPMHDRLQPEAPCLPVAADNIPYPRLRCTASGV